MTETVETLVNDIFKELDQSDRLKNKDHILEEHDLKVENFFNYCVGKWKGGKPETMLAVSVLLPKIVNAGCYKSSVVNLMKHFEYQKLPQEFDPYNNGKFTSTREHLWCYEFNELEIAEPQNLTISGLTRIQNWFEKDDIHTAILCYVPLPGFSTRFSKNSVFDYLLPYKQSPFVKLIVSKPLEYSLKSKTHFELFSNPSFQAIVKFKWHTFARRYFSIFFILYLITVILFIIAFYIKNSMFWIAPMFFGAIIFLLMARVVITVVFISYKETGLRGVIKQINPLNFANYFLVISCSLLFITSLLEFYNYFGHESTQLLGRGIKVSSAIVALTFFDFWLMLIVLSTSAKNIGVFVILVIEVCRKITWFLIFLVYVVFASAQATTVYLSDNHLTESDESFVISTDDNHVQYRIFKKADIKDTEGDNFIERNYGGNYSGDYLQENNFADFGQSLRNYWSMTLGDYSPFEPWGGHITIFIIKFAYSLIANVLFLNILIALVNKSYEEVESSSSTKWTILRAYIIGLMEIMFITKSQNKKWFPYTIAYEASVDLIKEGKTSDDGIKEDKSSIYVIKEDKKDSGKESSEKLFIEIEKLVKKIQDSKRNKEVASSGV